MDEAQASKLALFAGNLGGPGNADGVGAEARFDRPSAAAFDRAGNLYVTEGFNRCVRRITPAGKVSTVTCFSDSGSGSSLLSLPGVAVDSGGNVFVSDQYAVFKITPTGLVSRFAGAEGFSNDACGSADGAGTEARFCAPSGLAIDAADNLYVADISNNTIRKITPAGLVSTVAGSAGIRGHADGVAGAAEFDWPNGVATDSAGNVFVAELGSRTIRKILPTGEVSTVAGAAYAEGGRDGMGAEAQFGEPMSLTVDSAGNIYVADTFNNTIRRITLSREVSTFAGSAGQRGSADGAGKNARFDGPVGVASDAFGNVYITDTYNSSIRKSTPLGLVSTLAGSPALFGVDDGVGSSARFPEFPAIRDVAVDTTGNVFVYAGAIRKISPGGSVTTVLPEFSSPSLSVHSLTVDRVGNIYFTSWDHTIGKIGLDGTVTTLAGARFRPGTADGASSDARFGWCPEKITIANPCAVPEGIVVDSGGNIYVADTPNHTVRKISAGGTVSTITGQSGQEGSADGNGAVARFRRPTGVAIDEAGNVFVADTGNSTIRKITPFGEVTTLAGKAGEYGSRDGIGAQARFGVWAPTSIATDAAGNVYVADTGNSIVRKITPAGVVSTVVGTAGVKGFTPGPLPGVLGEPRAVAVTGTTLYITLYQGVAVVTNLP